MNHINNEKVYAINLCFKNMEKHLVFLGDGSIEGQQRYISAKKGMNMVGDNCSNWLEFLAATIAHFKSFGFSLIRE